MNNKETLIFLKGKKEGLRVFQKELKIFRQRVEEELRICREQIKEWGYQNGTNTRTSKRTI